MSKKYLDENGLLYFWQKIKTTFALVTHTHTKNQITDFPTIPSKTSDLTNDSNFVSDSAYVHTDNNYTSAEKNKLSGIAAGAEVNQNAFSNVKVGSTTVAADSKTDTLELVAGNNVTLTPDSTNDKVTIAATDTTYSDVTAGGPSGLMTGADKTKLNGIASGAEVNVQSDWDQTDTTADDYIKNKPTIPAAITVDSAFSSTSENPVQNKVINTALRGKANGNARIFVGSSNDYADTATKTVSCADYDAIRGGDILIVNFITSNTATAPKLNVNGTGAKSVTQIKNGELVPLVTPSSLRKVCVFVYGDSWILQGAYDDTTYSNATTSAAGLMSTTDKGKLDKLVFDSNNLIDSSILPSYVDDVVEAYPRSGATELSSAWLSLTSGGSALTPETGKIYVLMADSTSYAANTQFRWSGSAYVKLADGGVSEITNAEIDTILAS